MEIDTTQPADQEAVSASAVSTGEAKKHFARNASSNAIFFIFNITTSFFMVPYLIAHLGVANYGIVTLAQSFMVYTQVLTVVLTTTLFRFATLHIARGDIVEARKYFNTQLIAVAWFVALFLPISYTVSYFTPSFIRIPHGQVWNTRILFAAMYSSFFLALMSNPLKVAQFSRQRFDLGNLANVSGQIVRYSTWIILFMVTAPTISQVGVGFLLESLTVLTITVFVFRRLLPEIHPRLSGFDGRKFADMLKMGAWMVVNQMGVVLYLSIDLLIINRMLGPTSAGRYSTVLSIAFMLRGLSSTMSGMITPLAVSSYAKQDYPAMVRHMVRAVKLVSLGMSIPLAAICGLAAPFLGWWLGQEFKPLYPLVWWLLAHQVITCGVEPLHSVNMAANRMAVPGLSTLIGGVLKVVLSIVLVKCTSLGFYGVAIAGFCSFMLKHVFFTPWYAAFILQLPSWPFYKSMLPSILTFGVMSMAALAVARVFSPSTFLTLAASFAVLFIVSGAGIYYLAINSDDRKFLRGVAPWSKKRADSIGA